jgi:hypothetical protein
METKEGTAGRRRAVRLQSTLFFFLLAVALMAAGNVLRAQIGGAIPGRVGDWPFIFHGMLLQYLIDYGEFGFVRRGLVGTLVPGDPALGATPAVLAAATAPAVLVAAVTAPLLARLADRGLAFALAVSPALFWQLGYDLGRLDALNLLIALGIALCSWRWALAAAPLMLLIHEAAAAIFVPVLFALHWRRFGLDAALVAAGIGVLAVTAALVALAARPDPEALRAAYPAGAPWSGGVFATSIAGSIEGAWRHLTEQRSAQQFWMLAPPALYLAALVFTVARALRPVAGAWFALAAALTPLLLSLVATDLARWIALAGTNAILVALVIARETPVRAPRTAVTALAVAGVLGPVGILSGFPAVQFLLARLL